MNEVKKLLADIEYDSENHTSDIRILELLLRHAKTCSSRMECGVAWHQALGGDLAKTKAGLAFLQKEMNSMLIEWYVGAALSVKETEHNHD